MKSCSQRSNAYLEAVSGPFPNHSDFITPSVWDIAGDIHQPCYFTTLYNSEFPEGDRAGTRFNINHKTYDPLHAMFDGVFGLVFQSVV